MGGMTVRPAVPRDAAALADLAAATFPLACPPDMPWEDVEAFLLTQLSAERFGAYLAAADRILLVDERGGAGAPLAGFTMTVLGEPSAADVAGCLRIRPTAELSKCYVRAELQGRGTARPLLERTIMAVADRGTAGMWLGTNAANRRAQRFYEKVGFVEVGTRRFQVGTRLEQDVVMERPLR
jgi:ribosomal protein S18 acetylase RimI-like enzyme